MHEPTHEPFATSWLGISTQVFIAIVLILLTVYVWQHS
jgi:hypothetical protein